LTINPLSWGTPKDISLLQRCFFFLLRLSKSNWDSLNPTP